MEFEHEKDEYMKNPGRNVQLMYSFKWSTVKLESEIENHLNRKLCVYMRYVKRLIRRGIWFIGFVKLL
jgi:hypothetical protein